MSIPTVVRSKLRAPSLPAVVVRRARLERLMDQSAQRGISLVVAPAGFGKSVLLGQWIAVKEPEEVAWLTLDERDTDPARLGLHLAAALAAARPGLGDRSVRGRRRGSRGLGLAYVDLLLDDLHGLDDDLTVVLEDLDHLTGSPAMEDIGRLITERPPRVHFVVTSRTDIDLSGHRSRGRNDIVEIRVGDLRFTDEEAKALAEDLSGHHLTDDEAVYLNELTEGWPVAVQLAAVSLRAAEDTSALLQLSWTDRSIVDYLSAEVLDHEAPEVRSFLLDISVLDQMNAELCDSITGRSDGAAMLDGLERRALFVVRLPGQPGWYRLHRLVRSFLRNDLRVAAPARRTVLLSEAAAWCEGHDDVEQAAAYLAAAQAWDALSELIFRHARTFWDLGMVHTVETWVEAIPLSIRRANVRLRLTEAALHLVAGEGVHAVTTISEVEREHLLTTGEQVVADSLMCAMVEVANPDADTFVRAERALSALEDVTPFEVPDVIGATAVTELPVMVLSMSTRARLLLCDGTSVDADAARAVAASESMSPVYRVLALGTGALVDALAGRASSAMAAGRHAMNIAEESLTSDHAVPLGPLTALGVVARSRGDLDQAQDHVDRALELAIRLQRWPWAALLLGESALIDLARGDPDAALAGLRRSQRYALPPPAPLTAGRWGAIEVRARMAHGDRGYVRQLLHQSSFDASWELAVAAIAALIELDEVKRAREVLDTWPARAAPFGELERELSTALVEAAEGSTLSARARTTDLVLRTATEGIVGLYLVGGDAVTNLLVDVSLDRPSRHLDDLLARLNWSTRPGETLISALSSRELEVLQYLPSRLENAAIARELYVSTNTVKTHVKHIYQKLGAADRNDAIRLATGLGLLRRPGG